MKLNAKKNILLVVLPNLPKGKTLKKSKFSRSSTFKAFPCGLLSIATYLKIKAGNKTDLQFLDCNGFISELNKKLKQFKPEVVAISMMFDNSYRHLKKISALIKKSNKKTVVVVGGIAATSSCATILKEQKNVDGVCFYEGEIPLLNLVNSEKMLDFLENDISWVTRKSLREGRLPQKSLIKNLDEVVNIDYSFVDVSNYAMREAFSPFADKIKQRKQFFLITSRGCPFNCVFCTHSGDKDKSMRYASVEAVIKHVKFLVSKYGMNVLTIYDDQILLNKERAKEIFRRLAKFNLKIEVPSGLSVAFMDEELIGLMRKAGMDTVFLAIESGSPYVLNEIIHKPLKIGMVKPVVQNLRKHGFWIQGFFVSGLPGERDEHRDETVKFIKEVGLDWSSFSLAAPLRGSDLFKICAENNYIQKGIKIGEFDFNKFIINTAEYSADYVVKKTYLMNLDVNFVNNYRMKNKEYKIAADAFRNVAARYPNHAFAYYYLSKALKVLKKEKESHKAMSKYKEILKNDVSWREYAEYFNLIYNKQ